MYAYSPSDPTSDSDVSFANNPHGSKPVYLTHRSQMADEELPSDTKVWELRNHQVNNVTSYCSNSTKKKNFSSSREEEVEMIISQVEEFPSSVLCRAASDETKGGGPL